VLLYAINFLREKYKGKKKERTFVLIALIEIIFGTFVLFRLFFFGFLPFERYV